MFRYLGDPVDSLALEDATAQDRLELRQQLGLDKPFIVQFGRFVFNAMQGDFGSSYRNRRPVGTLIGERFPV